MTREEFTELTGVRPDDQEWKLIEFVYMWHPNVGNVTGKKYIANVYKAGGIELIKDMRHAAEIHYNYDQKISAIKRQIRDLEEQIVNLIQEYDEKISDR